VLLRFPLPRLPAGCRVLEATLRIDPGDTASAPVARRVTGSWTPGTAIEPASTGPDAAAGPGEGPRSFPVTALVAALYAGPDRGLLVRPAGPAGGAARLTITLGR
jgi:hypothetical protein